MTPDGLDKRGKTPGGFYRPELDGLRFFAFFAVYIRHTFGLQMGGTHHHLPNWLGEFIGAAGIAGTFGVDLFFVLSSFLITELLTREIQQTGTLNIRSFYLRRMLRIWPLYFFMLAIGYAAAWIDPTEGFTWKHLLGFLLFSGNWVFMLLPVPTVAGPLWSVSLEEQFYLFWPWLVRNRSPRRLAHFALGMMCVAAVARYAMGTLQPDKDWVSENSFTRIDGIAIGILLSVSLKGRIPSITMPLRYLLAAGALFLLLLVATQFHLFILPVDHWRLVLGWPLAAIACGMLLLSALGAQGIMGAVLRHPVIIYLGRISFGLYAYHEIFLKIGDRLLPERASSPKQLIEYFLLGLIPTLLMSMASYRWLEMPFLRLKKARFTVVASRPD